MAESRLFYSFHDKESVKFPKQYFLLADGVIALAPCFILSLRTLIQPLRVLVESELYYKKVINVPVDNLP